MSDNIDVDSIIHICKTEEEDSDPITSPEKVKRYFKLKNAAFRMFGQGMQNIQAAADDILKRLENDKIFNYSQAKLEREFKTIRNWDKLLADLALHDADVCWEIKNSLSNYEVETEDMVVVRNYIKRLKEAKRVFLQEVERTDLAKEKYHRKAFEAEKAEIKRELAENEDERRKYTEKFEDLKDKVDSKIGSYQQQFNILLNSGQALKDESNKYADAKFKVDEKTANVILDRLKNYATKARLKTDAVEDCDFTEMRINEIIKDRQPMKQVIIKRMERYRGTSNKEALFQMMREELAAERRRQQTQRNDVLPGPSNNDRHVTPEPTIIFEVGKKYLITTAYKKQRPNQISLTQGKKVTLLMPPNSTGFAFGKKKGKFGRKKKGYFPMSHVVPAD